MSDKLKVDVLTAFTGGELTPTLAGRIDREESKIGSRFLSNFIPQIQGGLKKFYGSSLVSILPDSDIGTAYKLVPFDAGPEPMVLLFVLNKTFLATRSDFYELGIPVPSDAMAKCSYLQVNDTLFFTSESSSGGMFQLRYLGIINNKHYFGYVNQEFLDVPYFPIGWTGGYYQELTSDAASGSVTITAGDASALYELPLPDILSNCGAGKNVTFEDNQNYYITQGAYTHKEDSRVPATVGASKIQVIRVREGEETVVLEATIGNTVEAGTGVFRDAYCTGGALRPGPSTRPGTGQCYPASYTGGFWTYRTISAQQVANAFASKLGTVSLSTGSNAKLIFSALPSGHTNGDEYYISFTQGASSCSDPNAELTWSVSGTPVDEFPSGGTLFVSAPEYTQRTASSALIEQDLSFDEVDLTGRRIKFLMSDSSVAIRAWAEGATYTKNEIVYSDGHYYLAQTGLRESGVAGSVQPIHTSGSRSDGGGQITWMYLHSGYGTGTITSVPDDKHMVIQVDGYLPILEYGKDQYVWDNYQWSMWGYKGAWPNKVFMFKNRLCYTFNAPGWGSYLQMSKTNQYNDFGTEDFGQQLDTSAINLQITGHQDNRINWVLPGYRLYMGSYSGEYNVAGNSSGAISPSACYCLPVSSIGGAKVDALKYEELNMFIGSLGTEIYSLRYDYTTDDYSPDNIGFGSSEMLEEGNGVKRMSALKNADKNVYFVTNTNELRLINNAKEVGLLGFYRSNFDGEVLDIASSNVDGRATMFVLVRRTHTEVVDGETTLVPVVSIETVSDSDCSYMLSRRSFHYPEGEEVPATIVQEDLKGRKVYVYDGDSRQFYWVKVPESGEIPNLHGWHFFFVGIAMPCVAYLNPASGGKVEGLQQKNVRFLVRLFESGAFSYGSSHDYDKWYEFNNWSITNGQEWNSAHKLMTGDFQLPASFGYLQTQNSGGEYPNSTSAALNIFSDTPEPFNLLMVTNLYV